MQTAKTWFSVLGALFPVLFFGGFFLYLGGVNESFGGMLDGALGSTRLGLGGLTLIFFLLFLWRLRRLSSPPTQKTVGPADARIEEGKSDFDADAAMARYLARRGGGEASPAGLSPGFGGDTPRPPAGSFGRKRSFE